MFSGPIYIGFCVKFINYKLNLVAFLQFFSVVASPFWIF